MALVKRSTGLYIMSKASYFTEKCVVERINVNYNFYTK